MGEGPPVWRLDFTDAGLPGVVVRCTVPTVEAEAMLPGLVPLLGTGRRADVVTALARLGPAFADSVLSWTVEHPVGRRVPSTRRGVVRVPAEVLVVVVREWVAAWSAYTARPAAELESDLSVLQDGVPAIALVPDDVDEPASEAV